MAMTDSKLLSDLFTPWSASPYYHLNPFMHSIMPTNLLVLGHIEKSKPGKPKTTPAKQKNKKPKLLRECLVLTQKIFWFSLGLLFFVLKWKKQKLCSVCFLNGYDQSRSQKKSSCVFLRFCFYCYGLIWFQKPKNKKNCSCFCFFEILVDSMYAKKSQKKHVFLFLFLLLWFDTVSKAKNTWVFWFFEILAGSMHAKKETHCFLLLKPNKTRENQKNIYFESKPNILSKVCFFGFAALLARLQNQHMMRLCVSACVY